MLTGLVLGLAANDALATSYAPPPTTLRAQMSAAAYVGEFKVLSVSTEVLDDGFPVSYIELSAITDIRGGLSEGYLILPGGVVDGKFRRPIPDAFQVSEGETLFLMLEAISDRKGFYLVAHGFPTGFFRLAEVGTSVYMADSTGRLITDVSCSGSATRQADATAAPETTDTDEEGRSSSTATTVRDGVAWDDAILTLASCGGAE